MKKTILTLLSVAAFSLAGCESESKYKPGDITGGREIKLPKDCERIINSGRYGHLSYSYVTCQKEDGSISLYFQRYDEKTWFEDKYIK